MKFTQRHIPPLFVLGRLGLCERVSDRGHGEIA